MPDVALHLVLRTPQTIVLEADITSLRVPTETGQVGLRPRSEASILAVEPGLVLFRVGDQLHYAGTAGGLLRCDGRKAVLLTPIAVAGDEPEAVLTALDAALALPDAEREARATLERLEKNIVRELHQAERISSPAGGRQP